MNKESSATPKNIFKKIVVHSLVAVIMLGLGGASGYGLKQLSQPEPTQSVTEESPYSANPDYEYMAAAAAWQLSGEAHALMMQSFNIAQKNVDEMVELADLGLQGYSRSEQDGRNKLYYDGKQVCVVCDIDDTLVDGVHYTANIIGKNGEWTNKAFTDFILSEGCTALPGAVEFTRHCAENGIALFYVTNRYDQGYKLSEEGYAGQQGYKKADGTVIGSSTYDVFGKTIYDITMESMSSLGFPINVPGAENYCEDAVLIVNDTKLNGSSKQAIRDTIAQGGAQKTGERSEESAAYPETLDLDSHHIAMLLGDDLNDISQIFSDSENAVDRVRLTVDNIEKWGAQWIVFPNAVYGSSANFAAEYGYRELFDSFDYKADNSDRWEIYR